MKLIALAFLPLWLTFANPIEIRGADDGCPAPYGCAGTCVELIKEEGGFAVHHDYCHTRNADFPCGHRRNGIKSFCGGSSECTAYGNEETWCAADCTSPGCK
ncbi:hypothetical protein WAI453_002356 [Rhynchosporium graminicola]